MDTSESLNHKNGLKRRKPQQQVCGINVHVPNSLIRTLLLTHMLYQHPMLKHLLCLVQCSLVDSENTCIVPNNKIWNPKYLHSILRCTATHTVATHTVAMHTVATMCCFEGEWQSIQNCENHVVNFCPKLLTDMY